MSAIGRVLRENCLNTVPDCNKRLSISKARLMRREYGENG